MLKVTTVKGSADDGLPAIKPAASSQKVAIGAASAQSAAIDAPMARLVATSDCHVAIGLVPTAIADGSCIFLPACVPEYFVLDPGNAVAVIQDSAAGILYITPAA
jgi:hypothetical protein